MEFSRSSNTFDLDGMSITLNGTFEVKDGETPVTFSSKTDTDKIIDVVKTMVEDYNAIVSEVKKAYSDMPLEKSDGSRYKPLTDEDKADMTEARSRPTRRKQKPASCLWTGTLLPVQRPALRSGPRRLRRLLPPLHRHQNQL